MLYKIDIENLVQNEALLSYKDWHIPISELERLPYWQYEYLLNKINEINKEEEKRQKEESEKYNSGSMSKDINAYKKQLGLNNNDFKMPSMPNMPKI